MMLFLALVAELLSRNTIMGGQDAPCIPRKEQETHFYIATLVLNEYFLKSTISRI